VKRLIIAVSPIVLAALALSGCSRKVTKQDFPAAAVPFTDVEITDDFWRPRLETNRTVSLPQMLDHYEKAGSSPDVRLIEAASYMLAKHPDPALKSRIDSMLDREIEGVRRHKGVWSTAGDGDFIGAGHFMEAAVAYFEATGSRKLLDVAIEIADDIDARFGPHKRHDIGNHEGIKMGLLRLYRATGNQKYVELAKFFLEQRGNASGHALYGPYAQDHAPVKQQTRAIGHAVRATYLYNSLTEIAALTGDTEYAQADEQIWDDAVSKRTYLTGGVGSYRDEEDFGDDWDLPNLACWNEICAAVGNAWWNHRMFLLKQDAKYVDVMERILYNGLLAGVSLDGRTFLYQTPLATRAGFERHEWFGPNCCPPNICRFLASLGNLIYARSGQDVYVNLFVGSRAKAGDISLTQETNYPWDGAAKITVDPGQARTFAIYVRIPGWAQNQPMPGILYRPMTMREPTFTLAVSGRPAQYVLNRGYARIERQWSPGDSIQLNLPMPVEKVLADPHVADDRGMVALERGPLVFAAEGVDNDGSVSNLVIPDGADLQYAWRRDLMGGIGTLTGKVYRMSRAKQVVDKREATLTAIPYYAFANRTSGEMSVWLARNEAKARVAPAPSIASTSRATSSVENGTVADNYPGHQPPTIAKRFYPLSQDGSGDIRAIQDQVEPVSSEDGSSTFLRLHPESGSQAWVEYDFRAPAKVSSVEVYWKDDKQYCLAPKSWRLLYKAGKVWKPVSADGAYGVALDRFNRVSFEPVSTSALRLEIELQPKVYKKGTLGPPDANYLDRDLTWYEGGLIEWKVNAAAK
jgi:DUF1680 family protein